MGPSRKTSKRCFQHKRWFAGRRQILVDAWSEIAIGLFTFHTCMMHRFSTHLPWKRCSTLVLSVVCGESQARSSHHQVARVAHAPPLRGLFFFFCWRVSWLRMPRMQKQRWRKTSHSGLLFTSSLLAKSGLEVTPLCREATRCKHRYRARAPSRSTSTQGSGARSAPRERVTECGAPVRRCITMLCVHRKMASSRWTFRSNKNLKKEQDGGKRPSLLFSTSFSSRILAHLSQSVCLPLVSEETYAQLVG